MNRKLLSVLPDTGTERFIVILLKRKFYEKWQAKKIKMIPANDMIMESFR